MRIVFMGTPDFAVPVLAAAFEGGHEIVGVYTQPDKPVGRKQVLTAPPVKEYALSKGLAVYQPRRVKRSQSVEELKGLQPDLILVAAYGQILSQEILDIPRFGCINMHASLLPKYRGSSPIQHCILAGDTVTGITAMQMDAGMDTGGMIDTIEVPIAEDDTADSLHDKLAEAAGVLTRDILSRLSCGEVFDPKPQDDALATKAPMLSKEDGLIHWDRPAREIYNQVRGLYSWPGTYTFWEDRKVNIWEACMTSDPVQDAVPGQVRCGKKTMDIACGDFYLRVNSLQLTGKKRMNTDVFLLGQHPDGAVFGEEKEKEEIR